MFGSSSMLSPSPLPPALPNEHEVLFSRIQWMMFIRIVLVTLLFGALLFLWLQQEGSGAPFNTVSPLIIAFYILSLLYAAAARRMPNLVFFAYLQFVTDAAGITLILLFSGGAESIFTWLFVFNILGAGYLLLLPGGLIVATLDSAAYILCLVLTWTGFAGAEGAGAFPSEMLAPETLGTYSTVAFHVASFYLLAFLSGSLASKQLETGRQLAATASSLHRLQDLHGRIIQNIDVGLLTVNPQARVTSFNRAAEVITHYEASEVVGLAVQEILRGVDKLLQDTSDETTSQTTAPSFERWMTRKDKKRVYLRVSASAMRAADGSIDGHILVFEDRTRLLLMEEQLGREERLAAVGRLSAGIAHEIRNPLASITGSVQVLRSDGRLVAEEDELLGIVEREADRLGHLVNDFLTLCRQEEPSLSRGSIGILIRETLALMESKGVAAGIALESRFDYDPVLLMDEDRMRQLVWNLLNNACQAMSTGGTLRVRTEKVTRDDLGVASAGENSFVGDWKEVAGGDPGASQAGLKSAGEGALRLTVEDTGPGINDEALARIFDPFYTTKSGGTGLGLAIVARIVQAHRGVITVTSNRGEGTSFAIWLPVLFADDAAMRTGASDASAAQAVPSASTGGSA